MSRGRNEPRLWLRTIKASFMQRDSIVWSVSVTAPQISCVQNPLG